MWLEVIFLAALAILGNSFVLEDVHNLPGSLDALLEELKERETRDSPVKECSGVPADIAFIIDDSRSIYEPDFLKGMEFVQSFVQTFEISSDIVRIAIVTFGQVVITHSAFGFDKHTSKDDLLQTINAIRFRPELGYSTNTAMAIAYAREKFFVKARPNVKKIAIVLTDGKSDNFGKTKAEAELLRSQGVQMIAIGVGYQAVKVELQAIATDDDSVFTVNSYGALKNIINRLGFITCKVTTTAVPTTIPTTEPQKIEPCDGQAIDFNFVFDSAQMGSDGSDDAIRFIKTVVSEGDLNNGKVRVGTVTGPCRDTKGFRLNRYRKLTDILSHFDNYEKTEIADLFKDLRYKAFHVQNGGRVKARKVAVVFLKGKLNNPYKVISEARFVKAEGIEIFIVNMGSLNHESVLESMVSGLSSHILRASDSGEIIVMARKLVATICNKKA